MLQKMRERTQGIIAGAIVALICITFALWGIQNYLHGGNNTDEVAKVNGTKITQQQLQVAYEKARAQEVARGNLALDQKSQALFKQQVLQQLINETMLTQALIKLGFGVGAEQLNAIITSMPMFQENGHFSSERMQQMLSNLAYSEKEFIGELQHSVMLNQFEFGVIGSAFTLPQELKVASQLLGQQRDFSYVLLKLDRLAINPNESEITQYYDQHKNDFVAPEKISIEYIEFQANDLQHEVKTDETELQRFYKENIDNYSSPQRWQIQQLSLPLSNDSLAKLQNIAEQIKLGKDFAEFSPKTVWIDRNQVTNDFIAKVSKLTPQQFTAPFKTATTVNLVKVLAVKPGEVLPFAQVKDRLRKDFVKQKLTQLFTERLDKLSDLTYTNSDTLKPAADALGLTIHTSDLFTQSGGKTGLIANPKIIKTAFSETVLRQNYNSSPIEIATGDVVVLRIKEHIPEQVPALDKIRATIIERVKTEKMQIQTRDLGKKIVAALEQNSLKQVTKQYNLTWINVSRATRKDKQIDSQILAAAFALSPVPKDKISVIGVDLYQGSYAIVKLNALYDGPNDVALQKNLEHDLPISFGQFDYYLWLKELKDKSKIKIGDLSNEKTE